ncbi:copper homeostasis protein CutC [Hymenobacter sediminis]|uniref:copper homeostasis protein CutC n=1 Tax=Hymenobacter sediminis TaxID=2218621 RepID=UPI000DA65A87|nr:copper homeostasis protein CutC [Hymenobacter sediminis]RPD47893.1 copper homeostasis protein CutC [Hymenobacter sediminis]
MSRTLEICANSVQSAVAAQAGGAHRIELCQNLEQGGITPSYGLVQRVRELLSIPVFALIRPRPGNFCYSPDEVAIMATDIAQCRLLGCDGVVLGVLDAQGRVAVPQCQALMEVAGPLPVTFHRAFDVCPNQLQALEDVVALGCQRILTSGGQATAEAGQTQLATLVEQAAGRISIMPGAGIRPHNIRAVAARTGATEFHASATRPLPLSQAPTPTEFDVSLLQTDAPLVAELLAQLEG